MNKDIKKRQKIYDKWHQSLYQIDIESSIKKFELIYRTAMKYLGIDSNSQGKLLDVACGKGLLLKILKEKNKSLDLYGSDISSYAISVAKKIVKVKFSVDDGEKLSWRSSQFDYVTSLGGIEYYDNTLKGIKEITRVLKKGGRAVIFVPNLMFIGYIWLAWRYGLMPTHGGTNEKGEKFYDYTDEKFFTYQGWKELLKAGGLKIVSINTYPHIGATKFTNQFFLFLYNTIFYKLIPINLAYSFVFVCKK